MTWAVKVDWEKKVKKLEAKVAELEEEKIKLQSEAAATSYRIGALMAMTRPMSIDGRDVRVYGRFGGGVLVRLPVAEIKPIDGGVDVILAGTKAESPYSSPYSVDPFRRSYPLYKATVKYPPEGTVPWAPGKIYELPGPPVEVEPYEDFLTVSDLAKIKAKMKETADGKFVYKPVDLSASPPPPSSFYGTSLADMVAKMESAGWKTDKLVKEKEKPES